MVNIDAETRFVENEALARHIAKRWNYEHLKDDIFSVARIGLWVACLKYDPSRGAAFSTYAGVCIANEIRMFLRREKRSLHNITSSLDQPIGEDGMLCLGDAMEDEDAVVALERVIECLEMGRIQKLFPLTYKAIVEEKSQRKIAGEVKVSQAHVSRLLKKERSKIIEQFHLAG